MKIGSETVACREYVVPPQHELERIFERGLRRHRDGKLPLHREMSLFEQAAVMKVGGNVAHFASSLREVSFHPEDMPDTPGSPAGGPTIRVPRGLGWPITTPIAAWLFMLHRLAHVADQPNWFNVSEGLAQRLMATDVRGVSAVDIRLPFHTFAIEFPRDLFAVVFPAGGTYGVHHAFVAECVARDSEGQPLGRDLLVLLRCAPADGLLATLGSRQVLFGIPLTRTDGPLRVSTIAKATERDSMGTRGVFLGRSITEEETTQLIVQFVLNVCLYLGSAHPDVRHLHAEEIAQITGGMDIRKARATVRERVARLKRERVFLVGSSLPVDSALREHLAQPSARGSSRRPAARVGTAIE